MDLLYSPDAADGLDTLVRPSEDTIRELQGMAIECGLSTEGWEEVKLRFVETVRGFDEKLRSTRDHANDYYTQTLMHFEQAVREIHGKEIKRVLEIGADSDFHFLEPFRRLGAECHAANLQFEIPKTRVPDFVHRALADMNCLPYRSGAFDLILLSGAIASGQRFAKLGKLLTRVWGIQPVRGFLRRNVAIAHVLFGFPLNVILTKPAAKV